MFHAGLDILFVEEEKLEISDENDTKDRICVPE